MQLNTGTSFIILSVCLELIFCSDTTMAQVVETTTAKQYHEQIDLLWIQKKNQYIEMMKKSADDPKILYNIQVETNNLLKYAGFCQKNSLLDELCDLYLRAFDTLTRTDQYLFTYYPDGSKLTVHQLDKKYQMWLDKRKPLGQESILSSAQFLYALSDAVSIIVDIKKENRTPIMQEALKRFIPLIIGHYNRWIFQTPGLFQVRNSNCRLDGEYVQTGMNHFELINKKLDRKLANGKSPAYCNAVTDTDIWIIAGAVNILCIYTKDKSLVPVASADYIKLLNYVKTGVKLIQSRFIYRDVKNLAGLPVKGAIFEPGDGNDPGYEFAGYTGEEFPKTISSFKTNYKAKDISWDLSHARRFVHVFETLMKSKDVLGLDFPTEDHMERMVNQLIYGTFNRDFKKPLFTNFMDGSNGWYRVGYDKREGFGYGPWDVSIAALTGGYGFWSRYNNDVQKVFLAIMEMLKSNDPEIRRHVVEHYETTHWNNYQRTPDNDFSKPDDPKTQSVLIQLLPSLCFMYGCK
jgi:hypothetical protein